MRHNSVNHNYSHFVGMTYFDKPAKILSFSKPNSERSYIKILNFIKNHPGLTRKEILMHPEYPCMTGSLKWDIENHPQNLRGYHSNLFANFLYQDFVDYDKNFRYVIKPNGLDLLKQAGL